MKAALDVAYGSTRSAAACVLFREWTDAVPAGELVADAGPPSPYEPGAFYRRELPALLRVLESAPRPLELVVVDGYVWLDGGRAGLGAHLRDALPEHPPVVGVAKTVFRGCSDLREVLRGRSRKPLFVTAAGLDLEAAAEHVRAMHGAYRIPTLLARVDSLARTALGPG